MKVKDITIIWTLFLEQFLKENTLDVSEFKVTLDMLVNMSMTIIKNKNTDYKSFFDLIVVEDFFGRDRLLLPYETLGKRYSMCSIQNKLRQATHKTYMRYLMKDVSFTNIAQAVRRHISFLDSVKDLYREDSQNSRSAKTIEDAVKKALVFESTSSVVYVDHSAPICIDITDKITADRWYNLHRDTCDKIILPILFKRELKTKEFNFLEYNNNSYLLEVLRIILEENEGLSEILDTLNVEPGTDLDKVYL